MKQETAQRLFEYRKANGYSQEELAVKIGVSRQAISKWERGESSPDTDNLIALARLYNISIDELINGKSESKSYQPPKDNSESDSAASDSADTDNNGKTANVSFKNGIHVNDGRDKVDISLNGIHVDSSKGDSVHIDSGGVRVNNKEMPIPKNPWLHALLPTAAVVLYLLLGFTVPRGWACGWILFLLIPIIETLVAAFKTKNPSHFAYPVLATAVFLFIGMVFGIWHPTWIIFITIPAYYALCDVYKRTRKNSSGGTQYYSASQEEQQKQNERSNKIGIVVSAICAVIIIAVVAAACIFGFSGDRIAGAGKAITYEHSDYYNTGASEIPVNGINSIEIEWVSGDITVQYYDGETIKLSEEKNSSAEELRWITEEGELKIKFCKSGYTPSVNLKEKNLTVYIPRNMAITKLDIDNVSGNTNISEITASKLSCDTTSGNMYADGAFNSISADSVSGNVRVETTVVPREISIDTISGSHTVILPAETAGFAVDYETVSGYVDVSSFFENGRTSKGNGRQSFGNGSTEIEFDSVSGYLTIEKA